VLILTGIARVGVEVGVEVDVGVGLNVAVSVALGNISNGGIDV
jgi:hypothetical protein